MAYVCQFIAGGFDLVSLSVLQYWVLNPGLHTFQADAFLLSYPQPQFLSSSALLLCHLWLAGE